MLHGADNFQADFRTMWTGERVDSYSVRGLRAAGVPGAEYVNAGAGIVLSGGAGIAGTAARGSTAAVQEGTTLYRVFGGEARGLGQSWTTVNPGNVRNYREAAGLFPGNTGQFVIEGRLMSTEGVLLRQARPGPGGIGGTIPEVVVSPGAPQICVLCVSGANPTF